MASFYIYQYSMELQQACQLNPHLKETLHYPRILFDEFYYSKDMNPVLNKVITKDNMFYCGYSDGRILQYSWNSLSHVNTYHPYQNSDVIDMEIYDKQNILSCTHTEVTLFNMNRNKSVNLKGHQQTVISVAAHPFSPLVVSVSNLIIHYDLRMKKPINVNFVTPPVYHLQYFRDGEYYLLSGEPSRIGKYCWMRTLVNGIGTVSDTGKYVLLNEMNSKISLWNWKTSQIFTEITDVNNIQNYQPVHFGLENSKMRNILFLEDDGKLLKFNMLNNKTERFKLTNVDQQQNWKMIVNEGPNTNKLLIYEHQSAVIKCFQI